nr:MAG: hypothetical protein [Picornaviridae sp.]
MRNYKKTPEMKISQKQNYSSIYEDDFPVHKSINSVGRVKCIKCSEEDSSTNMGDLQRISTAKCGIMKFARLLAEGEINPSYQRKYWQTIATWNRKDKYEYVLRMSHVAKDNMSKHMVLTLLNSFKQHSFLFDKRDMLWQTNMKMALGWEPRIKLHAQGFSLNFNHEHKVKMPPELTAFLATAAGSNQVALKFITMICGMQVMNTWQQRCVVLVQFIISFDSTLEYLSFLRLGSSQVFETSVEKLQAQASSFDDHKEDIVTALLRVIGGAFKVQAPHEVYKDVVRVKRIESLARLCSSLSTLIKFLQQCLTWVVDVAEAWCRGVDISTLYLMRVDQQIPTWMKEVTDLYEDHGLVRAGIDYNVALQARELHRVGSEYITYVQKAKIPNQQLVAFSIVYRMSNEMLKNANAFFGSDKLRDEPFVIYSYGMSGQGKSTMLHFLAHDLFKAMNIPFNRDRDVYLRNSAQDHWDGYMNQPLTIFDDYLQSRDPADRIREVLEMIRIKNNQPYPLKVAELANKGNTKFTSPLVFVTSNVNITRDLNVADVKAIQRRRDIVMRVEILPQYVDQHKLPVPSKIKADFGEEIDRRIYQIVVEHAVGGEIIGTFDYWGFVDYALDLWKTLRAHESNLAQAIDRDDRPVEKVGTCVEQRAICDELDSTLEFKSVLDSPFLAYQRFRKSSFPPMPVSLEAQGSHVDYMELAKNFLVDNGYLGHDSVAKILVEAKQFESSAISKECWIEWCKLKERVKTTPMWTKLTLPCFQDPDVWKKIMKGLTLIGGALSVVLAIYNMRSEDSPEVEAFASGDSKTIMTRKETKIKHVRIPKEAQGCSDKRGLDLIKQTYVNMLCQVIVERGSGAKNCINGILLGSRIILVPNHLFLMSDEGSALTVRTLNNAFTIEMEEASFASYPDMDLAVLIMPSRFPLFPKQTKHFINEGDVGKFYMQHMALLQLCPNMDMMIPLMTMVKSPKRAGNINYDLKHGEVRELSIVDGVQYECNTEVGDCGSPLIWLHPSVNRKLVGFHVAGGYNTGVSNIITHEIAEDLYNKYSTITLEAQSFEMIEPSMKSGVGNVQGLQYEGQVEPEKQFRQPAKSQILKSLIHGVFPPTTAPAVLRPVNGISPLELGVRKSAVPAVMIPPAELSLAINEVLVHYETGSKCMDKRVLTLDESINGIPGCKWVRPLNMKTSPGYPYIHNRKMSGKYDLFSFDNDKWVPSDFIVRQINYREDLAKKGEIPSTMFVDVLKDERRPLEKVESLKTRVFNTAPVDLNILIRKYFSAFSAHIMENHITHEIAVGINCHSEEWGLLYRRLRSGGDRWIAGDYSNYDKMFPRQLMMAVAEIANRWYEDGNDGIREILMETLACRYHLTNKSVFYHIHGNPSGNPLTVILNSLGNMLLMRIAWYRLADHFNPLFKYRFRDFVQLSVYGDDNIATVPECITWYNCVSISREMERMGMIYTPPKTNYQDELVPYLQAKDVTYLKRYFRQELSHIFAPLQQDVIYEIVNWIRASQDDANATLINVSMAKQEMFHYGKERYDIFCRVVDKACTDKGLVPAQHPYEYFYQKWIGGELFDLDPLRLDCDLADIAHWCGDANLGCGATVSSRPGKDSRIKLVAQANSISNVAQNEHKMGDETQVDKVVIANEEATVSTVYPTTFEDMAVVQTEDFSQEKSDMMMMTYPMPTLKGFLERPFMVSSGTWTSAGEAGTSLFSFALPRDLFRIASVFSKIKYFTYFRGDFKIGIRINGTKFHYGRIMMSWIPYTAQESRLNIKSLSCNKHVIASPSENEVREMVVPFAYPSMYYSMASLGGDWFGNNVGSVVGVILNPLQEGSATSDVNYTIYVSCVDPKLDGPTTAEIPEIKPSFPISLKKPFMTTIGSPLGHDICAGGHIPLGTRFFSWVQNSQITSHIPFKNFSNYFDPGVHKSLPHDMVLMEKRYTKIKQREARELKQNKPRASVEKKPMHKLVAQGKGQVDKSITSEAKTKSDGVISGVALGLSRSLSALSQVPAFGILSGGASALKSVGDMAQRFGFCKPNSIAADTLIRPKCMNLSHGAGLDNGTKMSVFADNGVSPASQWMGGHDQEMQLQYIIQTPSLLGSVEWYAEAGRGEELFVWPVCPQSESSEMKINSSGKVIGYEGVPSMVGFVGKMFNYWRGSLRYTFQIVASGFHSGRIRISFEPFGLLEGEDMFSPEEGMNAPNVVIDVQKETEVAIEVPFVYHDLWAKAQDYIGVLHMDVINPLTHSQDVCPPVYINVWVAGGENLTFAKYSGECCVLGQSVVVKGDMKSPEVSELGDEFSILCSLKKNEVPDLGHRVKLEAQGLSLEETRKGPFIPIAPCSFINDEGICMGEKVTHVKELTNIPQFRNPDFVNVNGIAGDGMLLNNIITPWDFMPMEDITALPKSYAPIEWFKQIFMFSRGSINVKMVPRYRYNKDMAQRMHNQAGTSVYCMLLNGHQGSSNEVYNKLDFISTTKPAVIWNLVKNNPKVCQVSPTGMDIEFNIPYYTNCVCVPNFAEMIGYHSRDTGVFVPFVLPMYTGMNRMLANDPTKFDYVEYDVMYSTGDDFVFGNLVGPPMMVLNAAYYAQFEGTIWQ